MRRPGFTLVEVLLAAAVVLLAAVAFFNVFSTSVRQSVKSENRTAAVLLGHSLLDELEAHPYGYPAPPSWTPNTWLEARPVQLIADGRSVEQVFHYKILLETGGLVGATSPIPPQDVATIVITWREGSGEVQRGYGPLDRESYPEDNMKLVVQAPLWSPR